MQSILIAMYLIAIVAANLLVTVFGPAISIVLAFVFIGLDLTARDALDDLWRVNKIPKMALLIATGSLVSWLLNAGAGPIAVASLVAFALAASADAIVYHLLRGKPWFIRSNGSNLVSGAIDSLVFPMLAFGVFLPWIVLGQFGAKITGGLFWSLVLE